MVGTGLWLGESHGRLTGKKKKGPEKGKTCRKGPGPKQKKPQVDSTKGQLKKEHEGGKKKRGIV